MGIVELRRGSRVAVVSENDRLLEEVKALASRRGVAMPRVAFPQRGH